jgi:hypothetical protein
MKYNKYIIVCSNVSNYDTDTLANIIKNEIAEKWFTPISNTWVIGIPVGNGLYSAADIRNKITSRVSCSVFVMQIKTVKNAATNGEFAREKTWNWIKEFDTNDLESNFDIPNAGVSTQNNNISNNGLGL